MESEMRIDCASALRHFARMKPNTSQTPTPAEREAALFERLRREGVKVKPKYAWMKTFGRAKDSEAFEEAVRLGAKWRAEVNRKSIEEFHARRGDIRDSSRPFN